MWCKVFSTEHKVTKSDNSVRVMTTLQLRWTPFSPANLSPGLATNFEKETPQNLMCTYFI